MRKLLAASLYCGQVSYRMFIPCLELIFLLLSRYWLFCYQLCFPEWFAFIGQQADLGMPGSPYAINFKSRPESSGMELMNVSIYSCGDTSLGCSCGDCPSSPVCSDYEPPSPQQKDACSISLGSVKVGIDSLSFDYLLVYWLVYVLQCRQMNDVMKHSSFGVLVCKFHFSLCISLIRCVGFTYRSNALNFHWQSYILCWFLHFSGGVCFIGQEKGGGYLHQTWNRCWTLRMRSSLLWR